MTIDLVFLLTAAVAFLCGWLARWQWDTRRNWESDDEFLDAFDRWDRS